MHLARRLGIFDSIMIVMGGIVGSGIFMNPYVVAQRVHTANLILFVWILGGMVALAGSFIYAELAARRPNVGGQYAYLREGIHPLIAFSYGWALLIVIQSGGMAAVALTFSRYFLELANIAMPDWMIAVSALAILTVINCVGVRAGSTTQSILMVLKIGAIAMLVLCGLLFAPKAPSVSHENVAIYSGGFLSVLGAAMVPVLFAFGGWQTSGFIAGEMKNPKRDLPIGLLVGVSGVILLYLAVNYVCVSVLSPAGLAKTPAPASAVMRAALGGTGAKIIALGIAISTLGFLSQSMLTAPRVYFAMAEDGVFFKQVAYVHPASRVPVIAIILQGFLAVVIALSGKYEQILNYVVSADFLFFGLTGMALFLLRRKDTASTGFQVPGHPFTTIFFIAVSWLVVINTFFKYPKDSLIGIALIVLGVPVYYLWTKHGRA